MLDISFEVNGRKVSPNNIGDALEAAVLSQVQDHIKKAVGSVRCSEHNKAPKIVVKGKSVDKLTFDVSGCCEDIIKKIEQKLK